MISFALAVGFTVVSLATTTPSANAACAYAASRLPRALGLLGSDTASFEETRAARKTMGLSDSVRSRASGLAMARALRATRLIVLRCSDEGLMLAIEAAAFDVERPLAETPLRVSRAAADIAVGIDELARKLTPESKLAPAFRSPNARALTRAANALSRDTPAERSLALAQALDDDPSSMDLRLAATEALIAARDFEGALRLAGVRPEADTPPVLLRALRFMGAAAQLESGRYAEAAERFEALRRDQETAAVLNNLGVARFRRREPQAAELFASAALLPDHRQRDISFNRSLSLVFDDRAEQSLASLDRALAADPTDARSRLLKVWALRMLNRQTERAEEWSQLVAIAPSFSALSNPDLGRKLERILFSERSPQS